MKEYIWEHTFEGTHNRAHRSTHRDISQEQFCVEIYRKNAGPLFRGQRFVRACAAETRMDITQEPFSVEIYKENAGPGGEHFD